jgi:two-component system, NarL family, sensor kinase
MGGKHMSGRKIPKRLQTRSANTSEPRGNSQPSVFDAHVPNIFRSLVETLDVGVASIEADGTILFANHRFCEILGLPMKASVLGSDLRTFFSSASLRDLDAALARCRSERVEGEMKVDSADRTRVVRLSFDVLAGSPELVISLVATEVTELVEKRRALVESKASVQSLSARILQLQDEERRRISRDLHDVVGQEIAVLSMSLGHLANLVGAADPGVQHSFEESLAQVKKIEEGVRTLSYLLHPPLLDELGLSSALHWYVDGFAKRSGIEVHKAIASHAPRFGLDAETALFRVVQESLANVLRHSGSHKAKVRFWVESGDAYLSVEDEGRGIAAERLNSANDASGALGVGISGMRQRLQQLGGALNIRARNPGIQVLAQVPVKAAAPVYARETSVGDEFRVPEKNRASENSTTRKRILIVDDHEVTRHGVRTLLASEPDMEICGEAENGVEAVAKVRELKPDMVLMDLNMPKMNGMAAAHEIKRIPDCPKILVFTSHSYIGLDRMIRSSGLNGYVFKSGANEDLVRAVRVVLQGGSFFDGRAQTA